MPAQDGALIGATGNLGPSIIHALQTPTFNLTPLRRQSSAPQKLPNLTIHRLHEDIFTLPSTQSLPLLTSALQNQQSLIVLLPVTQVLTQRIFITAALQAGIQHFIPGEFSSCDSLDPILQEYLEIYADKAFILAQLRDVCEMPGSRMSHASVIFGRIFLFWLEDWVAGV